MSAPRHRLAWKASACVRWPRIQKTATPRPRRWPKRFSIGRRQSDARQRRPYAPARSATACWRTPFHRSSGRQASTEVTSISTSDGSTTLARLRLNQRATAGWKRCTRMIRHGRRKSGRARERAESFEAEYRLRRADGAYRWHLVLAMPLRDVNGRIKKWFGTYTDIDDRKRVEQERASFGRTNG